LLYRYALPVPVEAFISPQSRAPGGPAAAILARRRGGKRYRCQCGGACLIHGDVSPYTQMGKKIHTKKFQYERIARINKDRKTDSHG
jgi:hypothetical protein